MPKVDYVFSLESCARHAWWFYWNTQVSEMRVVGCYRWKDIHKVDWLVGYLGYESYLGYDCYYALLHFNFELARVLHRL